MNASREERTEPNKQLYKALRAVSDVMGRDVDLLMDDAYPIRQAFKASSQNIGHSSVVTSISAYYPVSVEQQGELIKQRKD